jgi:hypothetical protein
VFCYALAQSLIKSEVFTHEKWGYTALLLLDEATIMNDATFQLKKYMPGCEVMCVCKDDDGPLTA